MSSYRNRIDRLKPRAGWFSGTVFRSTAPRWATPAFLLSGKGSRLVGGRWNPIGISTFYGSMTPEAAMAETLAHIRYYGLPPQSAMPRTFVAIEVHLSQALDLTDSKNRQILGVSTKRMTEADWRADMHKGLVPLTHAIARAAFNTGLEGLLVPSAVSPGKKNLVYFVDNLLSTSKVEIVSADQL